MITRVQKSKLRIVRWIRKESLVSVFPCSNRIYLTDEYICREVDFKFEDKKHFLDRLLSAEISRFNNSIEFFIYKKDNFIGWGEKILDISLAVTKKEKYQVFKRHCLHQADLSKHGYIDIDGAFFNWTKIGNNYINFDKNGIHLLEEVRFCFEYGNEDALYFLECIPGENIKKLISGFMKKKNHNSISEDWYKLSKRF